MTYEQMKQGLEQYNWDEGFAYPAQLLQQPGCDLALALEIFYLADGFGYFIQDDNEPDGEWPKFISKLYGEIIAGKYPRTGNHFEIPLTRMQKYRLKKDHCPEVFLNNL